MSRMTGASRQNTAHHGHGGHFSAAHGAQPYRQNAPHQGGHFPAATHSSLASTYIAANRGGR